jgi:hypothetical protein
MKRYYLIALLSLLSGCLAVAQSLTDSNLPIVIISTDGGAPILDDPRVLATMKIIYRGAGQRNYVSDENTPAYLNYNGRIDIEIRGSSSQIADKKQYGLTTRKADNVSNNNVSLLGMPKENDWILNGMVFDSAMIRDYLCYNLSRQIGEYASRTAYCEVIINDSYRGLYVLQEKIKADDNRVNIIKVTPTDNYVPEITGGYITKADKTTGGDPVAWIMYSWNGVPVNYIHELPKPEDATGAQTYYIHNQFISLEATAHDNITSLATGFPSIIDIPTFIDYIILAELASNADAYCYSTFFHKDRNGKLRAGPIWDYDLTFGNDLFFWGFDRSKTNIWQFSNGDNDGSRFWKDLFNNSQFKCYLSKRWHELTAPGMPLNPASINTFIDQTVEIISEAVVRENILWEDVGNHQERIAAIKSFISARVAWMTANLGSYSSCSNVSVPPLVITKIMYNPKSTTEFPVSDDLEFVEITNNGDQTVSMTGVYFSGTGLIFQFPANSFMLPNSSIILAGNRLTFLSKYGVSPFGQFTRNLSNKSQQIVLSDGFGNVIDNVTYYDSDPWPSDADGNGYYLKLTDPSLDNNVASNWIASNDVVFSVDDLFEDEDFNVYPNPVTSILRIEAGTEIKSVNIFDLQGRLISSENAGSNSYELDMRCFKSGPYILYIFTTEKSRAGIILKQ